MTERVNAKNLNQRFLINKKEPVPSLVEMMMSEKYDQKSCSLDVSKEIDSKIHLYNYKCT